MTATHTKFKCARPSHTQHSFLGNSWHRKGTASNTTLKSSPAVLRPRLCLSLKPQGHSVTLATWERGRPPRIRRKTILEFRLKNTMCASRLGVALAGVRERERETDEGFRGFSDTEVHPWNGSRSSKPPWTNLVVLLGERSKPQSRTLLFGFLLQRTSARRKAADMTVITRKAIWTIYSITKPQLIS